LGLYDDGIRQQHTTRLFSVGLLGEGKSRKLVPTKWSITAVDDIIGKSLHKQVLRLPWISDFMVYVDKALGNTVIILFLPSVWQFEALESWLSGPNPPIISDYEWFRGRKKYASVVAGAYYATRLPALEFLVDLRRQAGVIVFMQTDPKKWVPLGVWRFREIARRALSGAGKRYSTLEEAVAEVDSHLSGSVERWLNASRLYSEFGTQRTLEEFY